MTNLTEKEGLFLKALLDDFFERGRKSFLSVLFQSKYTHKDDLKDFALEMFEMKSNISFINNAQMIFEKNDGNIIGKKGEFFFSTCRYREFISLGRNIQDLPYYINFNELSYHMELEGTVRDTQYSSYIDDYIDFCAEYDLKYCTHLKKDFNSDILILDKEEVIFEEEFNESI